MDIQFLYITSSFAPLSTASPRQYQIRCISSKSKNEVMYQQIWKMYHFEIGCGSKPMIYNG